jgi:YVTN family beta-propeller protein
MTSLPKALLFFLLFTSAALADYGAQLASYDFGVADIIRDDQRDRVYATVPSRNSVVVIDSESLSVIASIFTGSNPAGLDISPDGSRLYVANSGSAQNGITILDLETLQVVAQIQTVEGPRDVAAGHGIIYSLEGNLRAYDANTLQLIPGLTSGVWVYSGRIELTPDRSTLFYYEHFLSPSSWYRIDVSSWPGTLLQKGNWGSNGQHMALSPDGAYVTFVSGAPYHIEKRLVSDPSVSVGQMNTGPYPRAAAYSTDGNSIFSVNQGGSIDVWNANTFIRTAVISTTGERVRMATDRKNRVLFAGHATALSAYYVAVDSPGEGVNLAISSAVELRWDSQRGILYQIQWSSSLGANTTWHNLGGPILGNGLTMSHYESTRDARARFYRVVPVSQ